VEVERYRAEALAQYADEHFPARDRARILADGKAAELDELRVGLDELTLRASTAGRVFGRDLDELQGRFLTRGALFCRVGNCENLEVRALISQDEYGRLFDSGRNVGQSVRLTFFGRPGRVYRGTVRSVSVGDVPVIRYPGLVAALGGEVVARMSQAGGVVPLKTQYEAVIPIDGLSEDELLFGMTGRAAIICRRTRLYRRLYDNLADTITPRIPR